jgi:hypothetical protein
MQKIFYEKYHWIRTALIRQLTSVSNPVFLPVQSAPGNVFPVMRLVEMNLFHRCVGKVLGALDIFGRRSYT